MGNLLCAGNIPLKKPVKYCLNRMEDMRMTGKRNPYSSDFKIGFDADLKIIAYEAEFYQNAGAAADLSPAVLERTLFHCTNSYFVPNVTATAYSCRTNPDSITNIPCGPPKPLKAVLGGRFVRQLYAVAVTLGTK